MVQKPSIHPLAKTHLRELREKWGVDPSLEEALWIVECCKRVVNPVAGERIDLIGVPVRCGASDEWLWPITVGAGIWYQDLAEGWWKGDTDKLQVAIAFVLAHARDKETLRYCRTRVAAEEMIHEWAYSLRCTKAELKAAVDKILPPAPEPEAISDAKAVTDWERIINDIEMVSGIRAEHWMWDVSRSATLRAWFRSRQVLAAQGGRGGPDGMSALDDALEDLAKAKAAIIAAHKGAAT